MEAVPSEVKQRLVVPVQAEAVEAEERMTDYQYSAEQETVVGLLRDGLVVGAALFEEAKSEAGAEVLVEETRMARVTAGLCLQVRRAAHSSGQEKNTLAWTSCDCLGLPEGHLVAPRLREGGPGERQR